MRLINCLLFVFCFVISLSAIAWADEPYRDSEGFIIGHPYWYPDGTAKPFHYDHFADRTGAPPGGGSGVLTGQIFDQPYLMAASQSAPEALDIGDLNNDELIDVAMVDYYHGGVSAVDLFYQRPDGTLAPPVSYPTARAGLSVAIADVNNDKLKDLVFGAYDEYNIYLMYQNLDGSFGELISVPISDIPQYSSNLHGIVSGDFNHDGLADVAAMAWHTYTYIFYQLPDGTLSESTRYETGQRGFNKMYTTDLNGDNLDDLIVQSGQVYDSPDLSILYQDEATHLLLEPVFINLPDRVTPDVSAVGDVNGDELKDLVLIGGLYPTVLYIYYQRENHEFPNVDVSFETYSSIETMEIADANHDHLNDILFKHLSAYYQLADHTIDQTPIHYGGYYQSHISPFAIKMGDINNDGSNDVVFAQAYIPVPPYDTLTVYENTLEINRPPVLNPIGNKSVVAGRQLIFDVSAQDLDWNDTLSFDAEELPLGASFVDNGDRTATFYWVPGLDQFGRYDVTFEVTDGNASDFESITIKVRHALTAIRCAYPEC